MRDLKRSALIAQPPARIFALINDIERYPEFVPWCTRAIIESRTPQEIVATLGVRRGPLRTEFTTRNALVRDESVHMRLVSGPFRTLDGVWTLIPIGEAGTRVELVLRFEFTSLFSGAVFEPLFEETAGSLLEAFVTRARSGIG